MDTQPTPRRVSALRTKVIAVAAANKHTAVVSECGEIFTWGCNKEGQLGYGTSNSASNYTPHVVEYLKGKVFTGVSAAKYHTIVLGADGEVSSGASVTEMDKCACLPHCWNLCANKEIYHAGPDMFLVFTWARVCTSGAHGLTV